jgi:multidrug efflux system membrane fusion protein
MQPGNRHLLTALSLTLSLALTGCAPEAPPAEPPPPKVTAGQPVARQLTDYDEYNGWLEAAKTVEVRARVRGHIHKVAFTDGDIVQAGQPLFELDPQPFEAEVGRAREQLKIYEAQREAAVKDEARLKELLKKGGASKAQVEKAEADTKSLDAQIASAKEEIKRRELDLEYSRIKAPISGKISRALLTEGNLVNAGGSDPMLTTIVSVHPIYVYFNVDERSLQRYQKNRRQEQQTTDTAGVREAKIPFTFGLETDAGYPHQGVLDFAETRIDRATGTIQVRGAVNNEKGLFLPGSRVRIRVPVSNPYKALLVPDTAILTDQDKKYLLVVGAKNVVLRRDVTPGKLLDDGMRVIQTNLQPDDRVILEGLQRARINYPVEPLDSSGKPIAPGGT